MFTPFNRTPSFSISEDVVYGQTIIPNFSSSINFTDETNSLANSQQQSIIELTTLAMNAWSAFLKSEPNVMINVDLNVNTQTGLASAGPGYTLFLEYRDLPENNIYQADQFELYEPAVVRKLRNGINNNFSDIIINVNPIIFTDSTFIIEPDLTQSIPPSNIDVFSILLHEIGHGLGFIGFADSDFDMTADPSNILPRSSYMSEGQVINTVQGTLFDYYVEYVNGVPYFNGPATVDLVGELIPLENDVGQGSNIYHFDFPEIVTSFELDNALMNPFVIDGDRVSIGSIELKLLQDVGYKILSDSEMPINDSEDDVFLFPQ